MQRAPLVTGEYYHIYNRGVDKRAVFVDVQDADRFLESMKAFNAVLPIGSLYELSFLSANPKLGGSTAKLVETIAYCLNPNHYHFILRQKVDGGISEFMKRLNGGYTWYFNNRRKRNGALFQGRFRSVHVDSNEYLLHLSAYVNLNDKVHHIRNRVARSSWNSYHSGTKSICSKSIILNQFRTPSEYAIFAQESLRDIRERKDLRKELEAMLLE